MIYLTDAEERLILVLREIVRGSIQPIPGSGIGLAFPVGDPAISLEGAAGYSAKQCPVTSRAGQCNKSFGHGQRHRYAPTKTSLAEEEQQRRDEVVAARGWVEQSSVAIPTGQKRKPEVWVTKGSTVGVVGKHGDWRIVKIETHKDMGETNVEVIRNGKARTFRLDQIKFRGWG